MPRTARVVIPGCPHHVTQRGNNRQGVFFVDDDRRAYLGILGRQCRRFGASIEGYCLMPNHVHLIVTPETPEALAKAVGRTHWLFSQYLNRFHGRSGHLWQNRFFSCPLDAEHFWTALAYLERNPVRAKLVRRAWRWAWSSAAAHVDGRDPAGLLDLNAWRRRLGPRQDWREALAQPQDDADVRDLRRHTMTGRPLGSDRFISKLETLVGRRLRPLPVGRPRKQRDK
jgi:putative transposase